MHATRGMKRATFALGLLLIVGVAASGQTLSSASYQGYAPLVIGDVENPFRYDGVGVRELIGSASVEVDASVEAGLLIVDVETTESSGPLVIGEGIELEGSIRIVMDRFLGPLEYMQGGIAQSLEVHGDSGVMSPVMPEMAAEFVGWGHADIYLDGQLLYEDLLGHFMVTERVRRDASYGYQVFRESDGMVYSPELEDKSGFDFGAQKELHLWVSSSLMGFPDALDEELFLHLNLLISEPLELGSQALPSEGEKEKEEGGSGGPKGNNGIGNGLDPQPPGNPPPNDTDDGSKPGKGKDK